MFRRTKKLIAMGVRSGAGAIVGAILAPLTATLRERGEFHMEIEPTCSGGIFLGLHFGPPCQHDHGDEGGGPEAFDSHFEDGVHHWSHPPPQTGTQTPIWN